MWLCIVLYGCVWAVGITQRVHHIENQHTVGSQAHTKRVSSRSLLPLSPYLSLFLRKRSYTEQDLSLYFDSASAFFPHFNLCFFFFFSSVASGFFAFTQYHPCISLRWSSQAIFCRTESHHWVDVTKNHNIFHAAQTPSSFSITSSDLNDRTCNLTMTPRTAHTTFIKKTYMTGEDWWQAYWTNAWLILWNGHSLVALRHQNYLSRLRKRWQAK